MLKLRIINDRLSRAVTYLCKDGSLNYRKGLALLSHVITDLKALETELSSLEFEYKGQIIDKAIDALKYLKE